MVARFPASLLPNPDGVAALEFRGAQHIDSDERHHAIGGGDDGEVFNARPKFERIGEKRQAREDFGGDAAGGRHFEVAAAR